MKSVNSPLILKTKSPFDKVIWMGKAPSNKAREARVQDLCAFLVQGLGEVGPSDQAASQKLIVGNLEDWTTDWPEADAVNTFVGLYFETPPNSHEILSAFENKKITYLWNEKSPIENILEPLSDLLKS